MNFETFKANIAKDGSFYRQDVVFGLAGFFTGGPIGAVLSPLAYRGFNKNLKAWALAGLVAFIPSNAIYVTAAILADPQSKPQAVEVAQAPAPKPAPVTRSYEYTTAGARGEMCAAGRQYRGDVLAGRGPIEQGRQEVRSYSTYLSRNSPASKSELLSIGMACSGLWN